MEDETRNRIARLFEEYADNMARRARAVSGSGADAEDAVQEVMLTLLNAPHLLGSIEKIGSWLYAVVRRKCVDIVRRDRSIKDRERVRGMEDLLRGAEPANKAEEAELSEAVARAVEKLDENLRSVFLANVIDGRTFREISENTGVPMGTLMSRKQKALKLVRAELGL